MGGGEGRMAMTACVAKTSTASKIHQAVVTPFREVEHQQVFVASGTKSGTPCSDRPRLEEDGSRPCGSGRALFPETTALLLDPCCASEKQTSSRVADSIVSVRFPAGERCKAVGSREITTEATSLETTAMPRLRASTGRELGNN